MKERWGEKGDFFGRRSKISLKQCDIEQNWQQGMGINCCTLPIDWWHVR